MTGNVPAVENHAVENVADTIWLEHCKKAVRKFLMNAVVIDDQPVLIDRQKKTSIKPKIAIMADDGMEVQPEKQSAKDETAEDEPLAGKDEDHDLNIRNISNAFSREQITCTFILPEETEKEDLVTERIVFAAVRSDIIIIDWFLKEDNSTLTLNILKHIAEKDLSENGRMRLICIYTGQIHTDEVTRDAVEALEGGGLKSNECDPDKGFARGKHHSLLVLNKQDINTNNLPGIIIDEFAKLSEGLLSSFALAAVAAIRRNTHHIISKFSSSLDGAYVANRLITDPAGDVAELIRELFVSECDSAIGLEKVADNFLEPEPIEKWLNYRNQPLSKKSEYELPDKSTRKIDRTFIDALLVEGISDDNVHVNGNDIEFHENKREKVSHALHGGKEKARKAEQLFARFVVLKRELHGNTKIKSDENWMPSLTLGTLLMRDLGEGKSVYYYCLTPACDTLRLRGKERTFLFLELQEAKGKTNLVIAENQAEWKRLFIDLRPFNIRSFRFKGDEKLGRVMAERLEADNQIKFTFKNTDKEKISFYWMGEVRRHRANRDMTILNSHWLRLGINDSEFLRLAEKGAAKV